MPTYNSLPKESKYFKGTLFVKMAEDLRLAVLGHSSPQTTMVYLHLTQIAEADARQVINQLFARRKQLR